MFLRRAASEHRPVVGCALLGSLARVWPLSPPLRLWRTKLDTPDVYIFALRSLLISTTLLVLSGCSKRLSDVECNTLLDHYTSKLVVNENPNASPVVIAEKQRLARELAHRDPKFEFDYCDDKVSRRQFDCAMAAMDVDSIERCLTL